MKPRYHLPLLALLLSFSCSASPKYARSPSSASAGAPMVASESTGYGGYGADSDEYEYDKAPAMKDMGDASMAREPAMAPPAPAPMSMAPTMPSPNPPSPNTPAMPTPNVPVQPVPKGTGGKHAEAPKALLIYRATINLAVFEARKSIDEVEAMAKELGGYLVDRSDMSITIRIPAAEFDGALEAVAKVGDELHRQVSVQDVTAEFRDMEIRLKNLEVVRERLAALLSRAVTVEEALRVEQELERVAGDIESIKGKLKLFQELISFSTITVNFQARPAETISSEINLPFDWLNQLGLGPLLDLN